MGMLRNTGFGLLLLIAACAMLFWAEGRAVKTARALEEGAGLVTEIKATAIDPAMEGKLVHINGTLAPQDTPQDKMFGVSAAGATLLKRKVEMFQWQEVKESVESDGKKTERYRYDKKWEERAIDSSKFTEGDFRINPPLPFESDSFAIAEGRVEAFRLLGTDLSGLGKTSALILSEADLTAFTSTLGNGKPITLSNNAVLHSFNPAGPVIGDLRISYQKVVVDTLSAVGQQKADRLVPFKASNGNEVFLFEDGLLPANQMFERAQAQNTMLTWGLRVFGLIIMFIGGKLMFSILTGLADFIPGVGSIVQAGTTLAAMAIAVLLSSLAIAAGWIFYRPLLALIILGVGLVVVVATALIGEIKGKKAAPTAARG
jgi:hypothetical protein